MSAQHIMKTEHDKMARYVRLSCVERAEKRKSMLRRSNAAAAAISLLVSRLLQHSCHTHRCIFTLTH